MDGRTDARTDRGQLSTIVDGRLFSTIVDGRLWSLTIVVNDRCGRLAYECVNPEINLYHGFVGPYTHGSMDAWICGPMGSCMHGSMGPQTYEPIVQINFEDDEFITRQSSFRLK